MAILLTVQWSVSWTQAASRHQCAYLIHLHEQEFILQGGDQEWLKGPAYIPTKLRKLQEVNKILAHRPWLFNKTHIEVQRQPDISLFFVISVERERWIILVKCQVVYIPVFLFRDYVRRHGLCRSWSRPSSSWPTSTPFRLSCLVVASRMSQTTMEGSRTDPTPPPRTPTTRTTPATAPLIAYVSHYNAISWVW